MNGILSAVVDRAYPQSHFRQRRFERFRELLHVAPRTTILDVGGLPGTWLGSGLEPYVTILNLRLPDERPGPFHWLEGNACHLPQFRDRAFDIVFSNSVIEHVGDTPLQQKMAEEIARVGKAYWVQTPYKHFPLEIHAVFPGFQYLPRALKIPIIQHWPFSFAKRMNLDPMDVVDHTWLLTARAFRSCFPDGQILWELFYGLPKSMIAYRSR